MEILRFICGCLPLLCLIKGQQQFETGSFTSSITSSDETSGQSSNRGNYVTSTTVFDLQPSSTTTIANQSLQPSSTTTIVNQSLQSQLFLDTSLTDFASGQSDLTTNNGPSSVQGRTSDLPSQYSSTLARENTNLNIISSIDDHNDVTSTIESNISPSQSIQDSATGSPAVEANVQTTEALSELEPSSADGSMTPVGSSSFVQNVVTTSFSDRQANVIQTSSASEQYTTSFDSVQPSNDISLDSLTSSILEVDSRTLELSESASQSAQFEISSASLETFLTSTNQEIIEASSSVSQSISDLRSEDSSLSTALALEPSSDVYFSTSILDTFTQETSSAGGPQEASSSAQRIFKTSRDDSVSSDAFQSATPSISQATYQTQIPATVTSSPMQSTDVVSESSSVVFTQVQSESSDSFSEQTSVQVTRENTGLLTSQSEDSIVFESTYFIESSAQSKDFSGQTVVTYSSVSASYYLSSESLDIYPSASAVVSMVTSEPVQSDKLSSTSIADIYIPDSASEIFSSSAHQQISSDFYSRIQLDSLTSSTKQTESFYEFSESSDYSQSPSGVRSELVVISEVSSTRLTSSELMFESSTPSLPDQASVDQTESLQGITESQTSPGIYVTESPSESFPIQSTDVLSVAFESSSLNLSASSQTSDSVSLDSSQKESASFEVYETDTIFTYTLSVTGSTSSKLSISDSSFGSSDYVFGSEVFSTVTPAYPELSSDSQSALDSSLYSSETLSVQESIIYPFSESSEVSRTVDIFQSVSSVESVYTEIESRSSSFALESTSLGSESSLPLYGSESGLSESSVGQSESSYLVYPTSRLSSEESGSLTMETVLYPPSTIGNISSSELVFESFVSDASPTIVSEQPSSTTEFRPKTTESYLDSFTVISVSDALFPSSSSETVNPSLSSFEDSLLTAVGSSTYGPTYPSGTVSGIQSSSLDVSLPSSVFYDMSSEVYGSSSVSPEVNSSFVDITSPSSILFSQTLIATDSVVISLSSSLVIYPNSSTRDIYIPTESSTGYSDIFVSETMTSLSYLDSESSELATPLPTSLSVESSFSAPEFDWFTSSLSEPIITPLVSTTSPEGSSFYPIPSFGTIDSSYSVTEHASYTSFSEVYAQTSGGAVTSVYYSDVTSLIFSSRSDSEVPVLPTFELSSSDLRSTSSAFESVSFESRTMLDSSYFTDLSSIPDMTSLLTSETSAISVSSESVFESLLSSLVPVESTEGISSSDITLPSFLHSETVSSQDVSTLMPSFVSESLSTEISAIVPTFPSSKQFSSSTQASIVVPSFDSSEIISTDVTVSVQTFESSDSLSTKFVPSFVSFSDFLSTEITGFVPSLSSKESLITESSTVVPSFAFSSESMSAEITESVFSFAFSSEILSTIISHSVPSFALPSETMSSGITDFVPSFLSTESLITESSTVVPSFAFSSETLSTGLSSVVPSFEFSSEILSSGISFAPTFPSEEVNSTQLSTLLPSSAPVLVPSFASRDSASTALLSSAMTESVSIVIVPSFTTSMDISSETAVTKPSLSSEPMTTAGVPFPTESFASSEISSGIQSIPFQTESLASSEISVSQSAVDTASSIVETMTLLPESSSMTSASLLSPTPTEVPLSSEVSSLMTSSVLSTVTPSPPPSTTPTINTGDENYWVVTVIKVRRSEDVTTDSFKYNIQTKLALVYQQAFVREVLIKNGTYEPLKRRKRYATSPDGTVKMEIVSVERQSGSSNTDVTYLAERDGALVPADKMVDTLGLLDDQEVALGLGYVVSTKAEPYVPVPVTPPAEDRKLWIIAAVLGPLALLVVIWIVVCLCCKYCCSRKGVRDAEEPHLMKVRRDGAQVENQFEASEGPPDYPPEEGGQRSNGVGLLKTSTKKMSYEVNPDPDDETSLYAEVKKPVEAGRIPKKKHLSPNHKSGAADQVSYVSEDNNTAKRRGKKKKQTLKEADDSSSQIENMVEPYHHEPRSKPLPVPRAVKPHRDEPTSHEDEEELMERAEMERLKNKQRLREQRKKEKLNNSGSTRGEGGYRKAQKEIDAVLGAPELEESLPDVFVNKPKKRSTRRKRDQEGHNNEAFTEDEQEASSTTGESLDEAKQRMHRLLDDAFSLISSSRSSIGNKVTPMSSPKKKDSRHSRPTSHRSDDSDRTPRSHRSDRIASTESKPQEEEKKHTPVFYNPAYSSQEEGGLETWSPYRAADEVALISLPQTQTVLDKTPTQERLQTTTFNESYPTSMRDSYYTTEPAKPIVIRTKDMETQDKTSSFKPAPKHQTVNGIGAVSGNLPNGDTSYPGMKGYEEIPLHSASSKLNHTGRPENGNVLHQAPKTWAGQDELDIVSSLDPGSSPQPFIRSLREELEHLSTRVGDYPQGVDSKGNNIA